MRTRNQFWLDLQSQYDIVVIEREHGADVQVKKAYLRLFVTRSVVGDAEVRLAGHTAGREPQG